MTPSVLGSTGWLLADAAGLGVAGAFTGVAGYWLTRALLTEILARRSMRALSPMEENR